MIRKVLNWFKSPVRTVIEMQRELDELRRQEARAWLAYALLCDVAENYGPEYALLLTDFDTIIADDKPVTVINYLNI